MNYKREIFKGFNEKITVFSRHFKSMECEADKLVLRYRYTLDELALLLQGKLKFVYSEKATKFCEIFTLLLSYVVQVKSKVNISQNIVVFSEYINFKY